MKKGFLQIYLILATLLLACNLRRPPVGDALTSGRSAL